MNKFEILITGGNGRLARVLQKCFSNQGVSSLPLDRREFDVTDYDSIARIVGFFKPQIIIHTGAFTDVDGAEKNGLRAFMVNFLGTNNLVRICGDLGIDLLYLSSDYIFNGEKNLPYLEDDEPSPINTYGWSKLAGEYAIISKFTNYYIVRTSFLFGGEGDFIHRLINGLKSTVLRFSPGHFASPTYYSDLARAISQLIKTRLYGIYHITNQGYCSRYQFAQHILKKFKLPIDIIPTPDSKNVAPRPRYSVLANLRWLKTGFPPLRPWQEALAEYLIDFH